MGPNKVRAEPAPRVVLDTNVLVSALLFGGLPGRLIPLWQSRRIILLVSSEVLKEYLEVLSYPKFALSKDELRSLLGREILPFTEPVTVSAKDRVVRRDLSDDKFPALAVDGKAGYIISGDKHLLDIATFCRTRIVTPAAFLKIFQARGAGSNHI